MKEIYYKNLKVLVDEDLTKKAYNSILSDSNEQLINNVVDSLLNYVDNRNKIFSIGLKDFFITTGIDFEKDNEFFITYTGENIITHIWFDFIGKIISDYGKESDFYETEDYAINILFRNNIRSAQRIEFKDQMTCRIEIDIVNQTKTDTP